MKILTKGKYYGERKLEMDRSGFVLSKYAYNDSKTDWHYHENPYFMYILKGNQFDISRKQKVYCPTGSLIFHNWQESHMNSKESNFAGGFHIELERNWFAKKKLDISLWEGSQLLEHPKFHHLLGKIYFEFHFQDEYSELSIELLLLQLCESIQSNQVYNNQNTPPWIEPLKDLIHQNSENLSLDFLSKTLGVHPVHLSRSVPKYLSTTLGDYIRQQKIKQAFKFLVNPKFSLTEIAYFCGFSDQSHFTRTFKLYFQTTPLVFRKQIHK